MNHRKLNKCREFSEQIRRKAVTDFRSGKFTAQELADLYHCSSQTIYNWIYKYSPGDFPQVNVVEMSESTDQKVKDLHDKIARLERALGQKQIKVDFLEKMIDLAEDEYDLDVKKSSSSKQSSGSGRTDK
jgi:transposase-like protein